MELEPEIEVEAAAAEYIQSQKAAKPTVAAGALLAREQAEYHDSTACHWGQPWASHDKQTWLSLFSCSIRYPQVRSDISLRRLLSAYRAKG